MPYRETAGRRAIVTGAIPRVPASVLGPLPGAADFVAIDARLVDGEGYVFDRVDLLALRLDEGPLDPAGPGPVWIAPDRRRVRFRVRPAWGKQEVGAPGRVDVVFRRTGQVQVEGDAEIVGHADLTVGPHGVLLLPSGEATSPPSFFTGPASIASPLVVAHEGIVFVGLRTPEPDARGLSVTAAPLVLEAWLDPDARERGIAAPEVRLATGRAKVTWTAAAADAAIVTVDARADDGVWIVGRHPLTITWRTRRWGATKDHVATAHLVVDEDGRVELAP